MGQWVGSCQITKNLINLDLIEIKPLCFYSDLAKTLGQAIEKDVVYEQQPYDQWSKKLQDVGLPEWMVNIYSQKQKITYKK